MASSLIAQKYCNAIQNQKLEADILMKLPKLVNCPHWNKVEIMGSVHHMTKTKTLYSGALVRWNDGLYFISEKLLSALQVYEKKFKNIKPEIKIIS